METQRVPSFPFRLQLQMEEISWSLGLVCVTLFVFSVIFRSPLSNIIRNLTGVVIFPHRPPLTQFTQRQNSYEKPSETSLGRRADWETFAPELCSLRESSGTSECFNL
jgi:hypothetical protein